MLREQFSNFNAGSIGVSKETSANALNWLSSDNQETKPFEAPLFAVGASNFTIVPSLQFQGLTNIDWQSRILPLNSVFLSTIVRAVPMSCRHLTNDEQKIFQRALRGSVRVIARGRVV